MTSESESYMMKVYPTTSIDNQAPIIYEFDIDDNHYADLNNCFHFISLRIMKGDRTTAITAPAGANAADTNDHKVAPINYYGNTLFENVELYLNGNLIETSNNLYPYKAFLQTFLSMGVDAKNNQLALCGYFPDTGKIDADNIRTAMNSDNCGNAGLKDRFNLSKYSKVFTALCPLHLDLCAQKRYLQNRTNVKIRMSRVSPEFGLIANAGDKNFSWVTNAAYLLVRMVKPRDSLRLAVEQALQTQTVKYPLKTTEMRYFTFPGNGTTLNEPSLYSGHLPVRLCLGLVDADALDGNYKKSPLNFKSFKVSEIDVRVNGKSLTNDPLKIDLTNNDCVLPYFWMFKNTGGLFTNEPIISYDQYQKGHFVYLFDLTQDNEHDAAEFHPPRSGVISVDIRLSEAPNSPVALVAMFEREMIISCDEHRVYKIAG